MDVKKVSNLSVVDLAEGGEGRITIYTEKALKELDEKFKEKNEFQSSSKHSQTKELEEKLK